MLSVICRQRTTIPSFLDKVIIFRHTISSPAQVQFPQAAPNLGGDAGRGSSGGELAKDCGDIHMRGQERPRFVLAISGSPRGSWRCPGCPE